MLNPLVEARDRSNSVSLVVAVAEYAASFTVDGDSAIRTARHSLIDALGHGFEALRAPECAALIAPLVPGAVMPGGARVPGTSLELDPAQAAFCMGLMLGHATGGDPLPALRSLRPADPLGAILAVADYQARKATMEGTSPPKVRDVLGAIAKALEIQGVLTLESGHHQTAIGTATIRLLRVAAAATVTAQLGGTLGQIVTALSYACVDGGMLVDADEPYDIGRRDWATADAISRAVRHGCQAMTKGHSSYLTSVELKAVDLAGRLLGAGPSIGKNPFGTAVMDRLGRVQTPQEVTRLTARFQAAVERYFPTRQADRIKALFAAPERLDDLPVNELLAALVTNGTR